MVPPRLPASRVCVALLTFLCFVLSALPGSAEEPSDVLLISIDGLRPVHYLGDDARWSTPHLRALARRGTCVRRCLSVFPSITYANHASLVTGVSPWHHGIDCNLDFSWTDGPRAGWNWEASRLKRPALWDLTRRAGKSCAAFSWPVSVGAAADWLVPELFAVPGANSGTTEQLIRGASTPGLLDDIERATGQRFPQSFAEWDRWLPGAVSFVRTAHHPDLTLVHVLNLDWNEHRFGPDSPETQRALQVIDQQIAELLKSAGPGTLVLVVGDHGFLDHHTTLAPNRLFADRGWIRLDGRGKVASWQVLARTNGGSAAIYCKDNHLLPEVERLLRRQASGRWSVLSREQLDERRTFEGAALALSALPGNAFSGSARLALVTHPSRPGGQHGQLPELLPTGLIAVGPGCPAGKVLPECSVLDVAPTVCRALHLDWSGMERPGLPLEF